MKFNTVRDIRTSPAEIWRQVPEEQEMVITNNGRPTALLTPRSDEPLEEILSAARRARAVNAVHQMRRLARERGFDELDPTEPRLESCHSTNQGRRVFGIHLEVNDVDTSEALEKDAFAPITGLLACGAIAPSNRTAVPLLIAPTRLPLAV